MTERNLYYHKCESWDGIIVVKEFPDKKKEKCPHCGKKKWKRFKQ